LPDFKSFAGYAFFAKPVDDGILVVVTFGHRGFSELTIPRLSHSSRGFFCFKHRVTKNNLKKYASKS